MNITENKINIKKKFENDGFVKVSNLITRNEIKLIKKDITKISKHLKKKKYKHLHLTTDGKINSIHNINKLNLQSYLKNFPHRKKLKTLINFLLNTNNSVVRNLEFFLKPKKTGQNAPYHQDNYYWNVKKAEALNIWIACSKANKKNGGIAYFLKSHKNGIFRHEISYKKGTSQEIKKKILHKLKYKKVYPNLKIGDCLIHHPEIIHGSEKNISNQDRLGVVISYKKKTAKYDYEKIRLYKKRLKKNFKFFKKK